MVNREIMFLSLVAVLLLAVQANSEEQRRFSYSRKPASVNAEKSVDDGPDEDSADYNSKLYDENSWASKMSGYEQTIQSLMMRFFKSSRNLRKSVEKLLPHQLKDEFQEVILNIVSFLDFGERDEDLREKFTNAIDSTFDKLSPELMIKIFADSLEEFLILNNRLTPDNFKDILRSLATALKEGEEYFSEDDRFAFGKAIGYAFYSFLVEQELVSLESFQSLIEIFISQLNSLEEMIGTISSEATTVTDTPTTVNATMEAIINGTELVTTEATAIETTLEVSSETATT